VLGTAASNIDGSLGDITVFFTSSERTYLEERDSHLIMENQSCRRYFIQKLTQFQRETMC
jgi:hypothetical protein